MVAGEGHHRRLTKGKRNEVAAKVAQTFLKVTSDKTHLMKCGEWAVDINDLQDLGEGSRKTGNHNV